MGEKEDIEKKINEVDSELVMHGYLDGWHIRFLKKMRIKLKTKLKGIKGK